MHSTSSLCTKMKANISGVMVTARPVVPRCQVPAYTTTRPITTFHLLFQSIEKFTLQHTSVSKQLNILKKPSFAANGLLSWKGRSLRPLLQPANRWQQRHFGFPLVVHLCIFTVCVPGQRPGLDLCSRSRSSRSLRILFHFISSRLTSSSSLCLLSRPVSSQRRYREDRLFHRQQHRLPAAQRDGAGGHPGDGVSASTRQVGHSSPLCESRTWSGV